MLELTLATPWPPTGRSRARAQEFKDLWRIVQRKMKMLDVAARIDDLDLPPGNRLKGLKGAMRGRYSVRVNEQYRVTFRWENGHAFEVSVEDYH